MGLDRNRREDLDHAWLDSLLALSLKPDSAEADENRIANLWRAIDMDCESPERLDFSRDQLDGPTPSSLSTQQTVRWNRLRSPWSSWMVAAAVLSVLLTIPWYLRANQAIAAIDRANQVFPTPRKYRIQMTSVGEQSPSRTVWLYLDSSNRFVIEHPSWFQSQKTWLGGDSVSQWIVLPAGPAFIGSQKVLGGWLVRRDGDAPYLHLSTILDRMRNGYKLSAPTSTQISSIDNHAPIECIYIKGQRRSDRHGLPSTIELWVHPENGMAQRVVLNWNIPTPQDGVRSRKQWTVDLVDCPTLPSNWFSPDAHMRPSQRIIEANSANDLESVDSE